MPNPLITTSMIWDADINPEGLAEQWKHTFNLSFGGGQTSAPAETSKDGKSVAPLLSEPHKISIDVFANFAQFVYDDSNPEDPVGPRSVTGGRLVPNTDAFMLAWQIGAKVNFTKDIYLSSRRRSITTPATETPLTSSSPATRISATRSRRLSSRAIRPA